MMYLEDVKYFGLFAVVLSWLFLILPALLTKTNLKKYSLSHLTHYDRAGNLYNFGLILVSLTLAVYLFWISQKSNNSWTSLSSFFFIVGTITCILGSLITIRHSYKIHKIIAKVCFGSYGIGFFLLALGLFITSPAVAMYSVVLATSGVVGMFYLAMIKHWPGLGEIWGFIFFTFYISFLYLNI